MSPPSPQPIRVHRTGTDSSLDSSTTTSTTASLPTHDDAASTTTTLVAAPSPSPSPSPPSPSDRFFGAIRSRVRPSRSRSRTRSRSAVRPASASERARSRSPSPGADRRRQDDSMAASSRPQADRHASNASSGSTAANPTITPHQRVRSSGQESDFERFSYGRHSNDWLFGGFSVRDTLKNALGRDRER